MIDTLGDRMKEYEEVEAGRRFLPLLPVMARIDGRAFHSFTKGLDRPYDALLSTAMILATKRLAEETNALVAYTQSDEITLLWHTDREESQIWFNGRIAKMTSQCAALATLYFYQEIDKVLPHYKVKNPTFDARVWQLPNITEAINCLIWRQQDAVKNSISMAAQHYFSHKQLHKKDSQEKKAMLLTKGVDWSEYPEVFKQGVIIQKMETISRFTTNELEKLPLKHAARQNPLLEFKRNVWVNRELPILTEIENKEQVLFKGLSPILKKL